MKKIVLSVAVLYSIFVSLIIGPDSAKVSACPSREPSTLLSLYENSDAIYTARYLGAENGKVSVDDDGDKTTEIRKMFDVVSVLKGEPARSYTLLDTEYSSIENEGFEELEDLEKSQAELTRSIDDVEEESEAEWSSGDNFLLFLKMDEDTHQLRPTDWVDGLKRLTMSDLRVYETRINELPSALADKPDLSKVVEWLVRCAEDPATRWEGTYQLNGSFDALEYEREREAERQERSKNGETAVVSDYVIFYRSRINSEFARLLDEHQKQTLANLLFNSELHAASGTEGRPEAVKGDRELLELVSRWGDDRVLQLLLGRLRGNTYTPRENSDHAESIASILNDDLLTVISDKYESIYYRDDDAVVDNEMIEEINDALDIGQEVSESPEDAVVEGSTAGDATPAESVEDETAEDPAPEAVEADAADEQETEAEDSETLPKKPVMTIQQLRQDLIAKFLARADVVMADPSLRAARGKK